MNSFRPENKGDKTHLRGTEYRRFLVFSDGDRPSLVLANES